MRSICLAGHQAPGIARGHERREGVYGRCLTENEVKERYRGSVEYGLRHFVITSLDKSPEDLRARVAEFMKDDFPPWPKLPKRPEDIAKAKAAQQRYRKVFDLVLSAVDAPVARPDARHDVLKRHTGEPGRPQS